MSTQKLLRRLSELGITFEGSPLTDALPGTRRHIEQMSDAQRQLVDLIAGAAAGAAP